MRRFLTFCRVRDGSSVGGTPHVHLAQATRMGGCWAACYSSIRHAYGAAADGHPEFTVCGGASAEPITWPDNDACHFFKIFRGQ